MHFNKSLSGILLVQPHPEDQMAFIAALENIEDGFLFGMTTNGAEALDLLQRSMILPDLIFMELNLPSLTSGSHCLREIKTDPLTNGIPVIAFVNSSEEQTIAMQQGASGVIFKPYRQSELRSQIEGGLHRWSGKSTSASHRSHQNE